MPKMKDLRNEGLFNNEDILEEIKKVFNITSDTDEDKNMIRRIQRYMKDNGVDKDTKSKDNAHYYTHDVIDEILEDKIMVRYFSRIHDRKGKYKINAELAYEQKVELAEREKELFKSWEDVGLTEEEGQYLEVDKVTEHKYLRADELEFLEKTGMTLRTSLSEEEKASLEQYNQYLQNDEYDTKKIEEIFWQKKIELMITALFNEKYTLDEKTLHDDIVNTVRGGKYDSAGVVIREGKVEKIGSQPVRRSYNRLKEGKGYVHKKK